MFSLDYPVTRPISPGLTRAMASLGAMVLVAMFVLNIALVGPEVVTTVSPDFNMTTSSWWSRVVPTWDREAPSMCDPITFTMGDTFRTSSNLFTWSIAHVPKEASGSLSYANFTLDCCDIIEVDLHVEFDRASLDSSMTMRCDPPWEQRSIATWRWSAFEDLKSPYRTDDDDAKLRSSLVNTTESLYNGLRDARALPVDPAAPWWSNLTGSSAVGARLFTQHYCPLNFVSPDDINCLPGQASLSPNVNLNHTWLSYENGTWIRLPDYQPQDLFAVHGLQDLFWNWGYSMLSAARADLGGYREDNIFQNTAATSAQIVDSAYNFSSAYYPVTKNLARVKTSYVCRVPRLKAPIPLVAAVLVATCSLFASGWAVMLAAVGWWEKRRPYSNSCEGHVRLAQLESAINGVLVRHGNASAVEIKLSPEPTGKKYDVVPLSPSSGRAPTAPDSPLPSNTGIPR